MTSLYTFIIIFLVSWLILFIKPKIDKFFSQDKPIRNTLKKINNKIKYPNFISKPFNYLYKFFSAKRRFNFSFVVTIIIAIIYYYFYLFVSFNVAIFVICFFIFFILFSIPISRIKRWLDKKIKSIDESNVIKELLGYKVLVKLGSILIVSALASLFLFFVFTGDYYWRHQLDIIGITPFEYNKFFADTSNLIKTIEIISKESVSELNYSLFVVILTSILYFPVVLAFSAEALYEAKKLERKNKDGVKNYLSRFFAHGTSFIFVVAYVPFLIIFAILYLPTKSEQIARTDIQNRVYNHIVDNSDYFRMFTDDSHNFVIYPKEAKLCRTLLDKPFINTSDFNTDDNEVKKQIKDECSNLGDNTFVIDIALRMKAHEKELISKLGEKEYISILKKYTDRIRIFRGDLKHIYQAIKEQKEYIVINQSNSKFVFVPNLAKVYLLSEDTKLNSINDINSREAIIINLSESDRKFIQEKLLKDKNLKVYANNISYYNRVKMLYGNVCGSCSV
ncbi:hypothetical protein [Francisella philomiragia]|uniref:Uncharacterized protein n=1 Tax=Francisella philomiragia TaxID=28110 RepID=A0ABS1G9S9_9GAMM|nr:hypothetical protein [Francisella philomiragia]MBK2257861.1 hypothetical protein [Francisella philomiragia]MBK2301549.1 hypothetical protein [Francisella philomiragia]